MTDIFFTEHWFHTQYALPPDDFVEYWYKGTRIPDLLEEYDDFMVGVGEALAEGSMPHLDHLRDTILTLITHHAVQYPCVAESLDNFSREYEHFISSVIAYPFWATQKACNKQIGKQRRLHEKYLGILRDTYFAEWCAGGFNAFKFQLRYLADDCAEKWQAIADRYEEMAQAKDDFYRAIVDGQCAQAVDYLHECMDNHDRRP